MRTRDSSRILAGILVASSWWIGCVEAHGQGRPEPQREELAPGISAWINTGARPGPTVLVVAGSRSPAPHLRVAARQVGRWPVASGALAVLTIDRGEEPARPLVFSEETVEQEGTATRAVWSFVLKHRPDWIVELDEGELYAQSRPGATGGSLVHDGSALGKAMTASMAKAVSVMIEVDENRFTPRAVKRRDDTSEEGRLGRLAAHRFESKAVVTVGSAHQNVRTEGASHRQQGEFFARRVVTRVRHQRALVHGMLRTLSVIGESVGVHQLVPASGAADTSTTRPLYLAAFEGYGVGIPRPFVEWLREYPFVEVHPIGSLEIKTGSLDDFHVVVFPGGEAMEQWPALGESGRLSVRRFVRSGGGYVGLCAGAYMTAQHPKYRWGLSLLDADILDHDHYARGSGHVKIELTEAGRAVLGAERTGLLDLHYGNGPLFQPAGKDGVADYESFADYRTAVAVGGAKPETMIDTPAIIGGTFGDGRVLASSGHPGWSEGLEDFFPRLVLWAAQRDALLEDSGDGDGEE